MRRFAAVGPCWDRQTGVRRTRDTVPFHRPCSAWYAGSAGKTRVDCTLRHWMTPTQCHDAYTPEMKSDARSSVIIDIGCLSAQQIVHIRGTLLTPESSQPRHQQCQQQVAAVLTAKGRMAAATYRTTLRLSTACVYSTRAAALCIGP